MNYIEREALPIQVVLKAIQNQSTNSKRKSDAQNGLNYIDREALSIEAVLKVICNQSTTMAEVFLVPKKVQKEFSCCFPLQKLIFASNPT